MISADDYRQHGLEWFAPPGLIRGRHLQSVLASVPLRRSLVERRARGLLEASSDMLLDCGNGIRLHGYFAPRSRADTRPPRGLAVLIHGWEGSADSLYLIATASHLRDRGYDVFRLNMRDHGPSHHLNPELFHSNRIAEVVGAVGRLQALFPQHALFLAGFSLGGNFSLRVALRAPAAGIDLRKVVAVCPVLEPAHTLEALESGWFAYRKYFMLKWRRSLLRKAECFPELYDFSNIDELKSLTEMTDHFVQYHSGFPDLDAYLKGYALTDDVLAPLAVPSHILFAADDPVIPARDLERLARPETLTISLTPHGGHCGYMETYRLKSWVERQIGSLFDAASTA
jgi:predicted alpha/beta-fold hydrolase